MFPDLFLPNALICAAGLAAALIWLRTGMVHRGLLLLVAIALATDVALVARFVFALRTGWFFVGLWCMQAVALVGAGWLLLALARRRWTADARRRDELFTAGFQHYLRDELAAAADLFRRILRADPWDVPATIALANVAWRQGRIARARRLLHRAQRLDRPAAYADFVVQQLRRVTAPAPPAPLPAAEPARAGAEASTP